jgi:hypothetical protein
LLRAGLGLGLGHQLLAGQLHHALLVAPNAHDLQLLQRQQASTALSLEPSSCQPGHRAPPPGRQPACGPAQGSATGRALARTPKGRAHPLSSRRRHVAPAPPAARRARRAASPSSAG